LAFDREVITEESVQKINKDPSKSYIEVTPLSVTGYVTVLDDTGLTARQSAAVKAAAGIIGVLGTLLGYPLWKRYFESRARKTAGGQSTRRRRRR
jgi:hypothetical protein